MYGGKITTSYISGESVYSLTISTARIEKKTTQITLADGRIRSVKYAVSQAPF